MRLIWLAPLVAALGVSVPAHANDSTAALGAGGLTLTESADIRMASEDLFISKEQIRVSYRFVNESGAPITTRVAFPLPDLDMAEMGEVDLNWPTDNPSNALNFKVTVDGRAVRPKLEKQAFFKGESISDVLRRLGVPLGYPQKGFDETLKALPASAKQELTRRGLADFTGDYPHALWTAKETFHWEQTFPSDRELRVAHSYNPVVGGSFLSSSEFPEIYRKDKFFQRFCIDKTTEAAIARQLKVAGGGRKDEPGLLMAWYVDYVLTTGRNWKGPIGSFRLTVDKGNARNIVSFCGENVRKAGPTTFVMERRDFEPDEDLHIMIVEPRPPLGAQ